MNNSDYTSIGLMELDEYQSRTINGGAIFIKALIFFCGALAGDILLNPSAAGDAFMDGWNAARNQ